MLPKVIEYSSKDYITNEEARRMIRTPIGEYNESLTLVEKRTQTW